MSEAGTMTDGKFWQRTLGCVALALLLSCGLGAQTVQTAKATDGPGATGVAHPPAMSAAASQPGSALPSSTTPVAGPPADAVPAASSTVQPVVSSTTPAVQPSEVTPLTTAVTELAPDQKPMAEGDFYYVVEPGDTVTVSFRFTPEFNDEVVVGPDGRAELKSVGDVKLAGMTLPEIQRMVVRDSSSKLVNPEVTVSLKDFQRPQIVVAGEVQTPGHFELRKPTTVLQAILMAGGPKEDGAMGHVVLFRKLNSETAEVHVLKLGKYDAASRTRNDLTLQPDDMILVTHDRISRIDRYVKLINLGVYLNPIGNNGVF